MIPMTYRNVSLGHIGKSILIILEEIVGPAQVLIGELEAAIPYQRRIQTSDSKEVTGRFRRREAAARIRARTERDAER